MKFLFVDQMKGKDEDGHDIRKPKLWELSH